METETEEDIELKRWTFYIDECGNTGTNWLDSKQPFFIYGGWLLNDDKYDTCISDIESLYVGQQIKEIKAVKFFKKGNAYAKFATFFWKLIKKYKAVPVFAIVEKRFMVAAKIVETFFDPAYNPNVNYKFTYPGQWKVDLAEEIVKYNDVIESFGEVIAYKKNTSTQMKKVCDMLIDSLKNNGYKEVACLLENLNEQNYLDMVDEFDTLTENGAKKRWITLTHSTMYELLKNVELYARVNGHKVSVVHDELSHYEDVFKQIADIHLNCDKGELEIWNGRTVLISYPHIEGLCQKNSTEEIMIQMADLLCGFVYNTIGYPYGETCNCTEEISGIWKFLIGLHDSFLKENIQIWNFYCSSIFKERLKKII